MMIPVELTFFGVTWAQLINQELSVTLLNGSLQKKYL